MKYKYYIVYIYTNAVGCIIGTCYMSRSKKIKTEDDIRIVKESIQKECTAGTEVSLLSWRRIKR